MRIPLALVTALLLTGPWLAGAQSEQKVFRIGAVSAGAPRSSPHWVAFRQRLGGLGYVEGKNLSIEFRSAEGRPERFPELRSGLARSGVDLILPVGPEASLRAAREATTTVPIVVVRSTMIRSLGALFTDWRGQAATSRACSCVSRS